MRTCSGGLRERGALNDTVRLSKATSSPGSSSDGVSVSCERGLAATEIGPEGGSPAGGGLAPAAAGPDGRAGPEGRLPGTGPLATGPAGPGLKLPGTEPGSA